jgi:hypothetical protein
VHRLCRILLNVATVLSLLLCMATVPLWVRSYPARDGIYVYRNFGPAGKGGGDHLYLMSERGRAVVMWGRALYEWDPLDKDPTSPRLPRLEIRATSEAYSGSWDRQPFEHQILGFGYTITPQWQGLGARYVVDDQAAAPFWAILVISAVLPTTAARRLVKKRRRLANGHCPCCGYDMRATPDRCPECGAESCRAVPASSARPARPGGAGA